MKIIFLAHFVTLYKLCECGNYGNCKIFAIVMEISEDLC